MYWIYQRHAIVHLSRRTRPASEHVMSLSVRRISADSTEHVMERPKYQTNDTASLRMRTETDRITAHAPTRMSSAGADETNANKSMNYWLTITSGW